MITLKMPQIIPLPAKLTKLSAFLGQYELKRWKNEKKNRQDLLSKFLEISDSIGLNDYLPKSYFDQSLEIIPLRFVYTHPSAEKIRKKMSKYVDVEWFWFNKPIITCENPEDLGYIYENCPISESVCNEIINWPCIFDISNNNHLLQLFKQIHSSKL